MDQCPFEFNITVIGMEVDDFIDILNKKGYREQAKTCQKQFEKQLNDLTNGQ